MVEWERKVGPLTLNFRVLLEPKGFLRIIIAVSEQIGLPIVGLVEFFFHRVSRFFNSMGVIPLVCMR